MRLENSFRVPAPPEAAWALLNDVPRVVPCMPGAELNEVVGENEWRATMHVKLGPISLQFGTEITREEADETAKRVVLQTKANELKGRGGARATIESSLSEVEGETNVTIATDLTLQGAVAQYGRGIVADVAAQLTKQFAECLASKLEQNGGAAPAPGADGGAGAAAEAASAPAGARPAEVKPIGGLRLGLTALLRSFLGLFRRGSRGA
jgi:carbon monoxide dehydrogenase subunit G